MLLPYIKTDLVEVTDKLEISSRVFFKKENQQPSGSFKLRGLSFFIARSIEKARNLGKANVEVFSSSGGNAGLAAAYSSRELNLKCTVVVPKLVKPSVVEDLKLYGAVVHIKGNHWGEADAYLREELINKLDELIYPVYCHPFDHEWIWQGHASMIQEIEDQLSPQDLSKVKGIICSVGGGGLFNGVIEGLDKSKYLKNVQVLAVESDGAPTFAEAVKQDKVVILPSVNTLATSLASPYISSKSLQNYKSHRIHNVVIKDIDTVKGTLFYKDTFDEIVEPACGASISIISDNKEFLGNLGPLQKDDIIIVIVCGGTVTKEADLASYRNLVATS